MTERTPTPIVHDDYDAVEPTAFTSSDAVDHPAHYTHAGPTYEAIRVIEAWRLGYCLGNAIKYIARAEHKGSRLDDLKKARWYLDREIGRREGGD